MPEPISSSNSSQSSGLSRYSDPTLDETGLVCRTDAPNSSQPPLLSEPPPAVTKLIGAASPPALVLPPSSKGTPPSEAQNNAQRTSGQRDITSYANAGVTGGARDAAYAGAAALKGHDPKTGIEVEVFSGSAQAGGENEAQAGMVRLGLSGKNGSVTGEAFTLRANGGAHNDDGSIGINSGFVASLIGAEGTLAHGADSLTFGASLGGGVSVSVGLRDIDNNDKPELCVKVTSGPVTLGFCAED